MKPFLFYVSTLLLGLWLQIVVNHFFGGSWFSLQIMLVSVIYWGLMRGPVSGAMIGFSWGLLIDSSSLGFLGLHGLLWTLVGFATGVLRRQLDESKPWTQTIFTFVMSIAYSLSLLAIERLLIAGDRSIQLASILEPLWNALLAPFVFVGLHAWERLWEMRPERR